MAVVNNKKGMKGGRMNFILNGNKIPHTIINIPSDGVYLGVYINMYMYYFIYLFIHFFIIFLL
jgi:hypothetical protein